jgi:hypothetical protein
MRVGCAVPECTQQPYRLLALPQLAIGATQAEGAGRGGRGQPGQVEVEAAEEDPEKMSLAHKTGLAKLHDVVEWLMGALGQGREGGAWARGGGGSGGGGGGGRGAGGSGGGGGVEDEDGGCGAGGGCGPAGPKFLVFAHHRWAAGGGCERAGRRRRRQGGRQPPLRSALLVPRRPRQPHRAAPGQHQRHHQHPPRPPRPPGT